MDFEQLKQAHDIVDVCARLNIALKKVGRDYWACCPLHSEKTPSFQVSADYQNWHCWGACDKGGDVIDLVREVEGLKTNGAAGRWLAGHRPSKARRLSRLPQPDQQRNFWWQNERVINEWQAALFNERRDILAWLNGRGINDHAIIHFDLGYNEYKDQRWLTIPIRDGGRLVNVERRRDPCHVDGDQLKYKSMTGGQKKVLWGIQEAWGSPLLIVVESVLDAMALRCAIPRPCVVAGSAAHIEPVWLSRFHEIIILADRDETGRKHAMDLKRAIRRARIVHTPYGKDYGEFYALDHRAAFWWVRGLARQYGGREIFNLDYAIERQVIGGASHDGNVIHF